jgi:ATP-binding cassette subfamily B protein
MTYLRRYLSGQWYLLAVGLFLTLLNVAGTLTVPILIGRAIDCMVYGGVDFSLLGRYLALVAALVVLSGVSQWGAKVCYNRATYMVAYHMRLDLVAKIQHLPLSYLDAHPTGSTLGRVVADVETVTDGLLLGFSQLFGGVATILGTLVILFTINWVVALVVLFVTPLSLFVSRAISRHTHAHFTRTAAIRAEETAVVEESVSCQKTVQAYRAEDAMQTRFDRVNDLYAAESQKAIFYSSLTNPMTRFVNAIVYAAVTAVGALSVAGLLPIGAALTVGSLTVILSYANQYTKPFNEVSGVITELQNAVACLRRIAELDLEPVERDDGTLSLPDAIGRVRLSGVAFSYDKSKPLLRDIDVEVDSGMRVAIVGTTGCGKTTLINLIMRFYELDAGSITIDGVDITALPRAELRSRIGMVLQDTWVRHASIVDNLRLGAPDATIEQVVEAARLTHAHSFISRLPEGYDTVIADDGSLSEGQLQLLCVTRVLLTHPSLLILDEATSNIDIRTEQAVNRAFDLLMQGKTSFVVAHRLSTVRDADLILVMRDGVIVERGTHEALLAAGGVYDKLYRGIADE